MQSGPGIIQIALIPALVVGATFPGARVYASVPLAGGAAGGRGGTCPAVRRPISYKVYLPQSLAAGYEPLDRRNEAMQEGIHPTYIPTTVTCSCGNSFVTRSTRKELKVDICSACHPFFTGKLKYIDTAGRIEKFQNKFAAGSYTSAQKPKAVKKKKPASVGDEG
jgi:large subunit ribosomal protein L31